MVAVQSVVKISGALRSTLSRASSVRSSRSPVCPASTSVRQAMRMATPSAASSGPCPHTSPTTTCTEPSGVCTVS